MGNGVLRFCRQPERGDSPTGIGHVGDRITLPRWKGDKRCRVRVRGVSDSPGGAADLEKTLERAISVSAKRGQDRRCQLECPLIGLQGVMIAGAEAPSGGA